MHPRLVVGLMASQTGDCGVRRHARCAPAVCKPFHGQCPDDTTSVCSPPWPEPRGEVHVVRLIPLLDLGGLGSRHVGPASSPTWRLHARAARGGNAMWIGLQAQVCGFVLAEQMPPHAGCPCCLDFDVVGLRSHLSGPFPPPYVALFRRPCAQPRDRGITLPSLQAGYCRGVSVGNAAQEHSLWCPCSRRVTDPITPDTRVSTSHGIPQ